MCIGDCGIQGRALAVLLLASVAGWSELNVRAEHHSLGHLGLPGVSGAGGGQGKFYIMAQFKWLRFQLSSAVTSPFGYVWFLICILRVGVFHLVHIKSCSHL